MNACGGLTFGQPIATHVAFANDASLVIVLWHVVRTRIFVTDIGLWEDVARAHAEGFGAAPPATSMVEVSKLIDPRMLVEIEANAIKKLRGQMAA